MSKKWREASPKPDEIKISETSSTEDRDRQLADRWEEMKNHEWRQRGNQVYCTACPFDHAFYVGTDVLLVGQKDGLPEFDRFS